MNTIRYDLTTGTIIGFTSGATLEASVDYGVLYATKDLPDLVNCVVLEDRLVPRMSQEYALSDKSPISIKELFWKERRAALLAESDFMMLPDVGDDAFQGRAREYRQKLRDLTLHENWPCLSLEDLPQKPNPKAVQLTVL